MIECLFSPEHDYDHKELFNSDKLKIFNPTLQISECQRIFKKGYIENSTELLKLDHEVYVVGGEKPLNSLQNGFFSGENCSFVCFGNGFLETEEHQKLLKERIQRYLDNSLELLMNNLIFEINEFCFDSGGGFSLVMYVNINKKRYLIFGRDRRGESSLLMSIGSKGNEIILSNIESKLLNFQEGPQSLEIPILGLFALDLSTLEFTLFPWNEPCIYSSPEFWSYRVKNTTDSFEEDSKKLLESLRSIFTNCMMDKLTVEIINEKAFVYFGLLFSGGIDSTLLLFLLLEWIFSNPEGLEKIILDRFLPNKEESINKNIFFIVELINVTFAPGEAPDRITGLSSYYEILKLFRDHFEKYKVSLRLICVDKEGENLITEERNILRCIAPCRTHLDFNIGGALFFAFKGEGILANPNCFEEEWWQDIISDQKKSSTWNGIFEKNSLLDLHSEELRGFEPHNKSLEPHLHKKCRYCPLKEHSKCQNKCCKSCCRKIQQNLIFPDVDSYPACRVHRMKMADFSKIPSTQRYIDPLNYYLSEKSISQVLFEDEELVNDLLVTKNGNKLYRAKSKFLIIGSGADEFLGGYGRHITAKKHNGSDGIRTEMLFDIKRLWIRNLGRDNRLALFNERRLFAPFLQDSTIKTIGGLNFENICDSQFETTKPLLRHIASELGLKLCSKFKKRAVQFGTRSCRQTNLKHFESNRKATADAEYTPINKH
ncbi:Asparagine synthase family protein [Cryptosporidium felis]|nr:Asparagine synthase family protein [Cryptosporidium felis]